MPGYEKSGVNYDFGAINVFQKSWCTINKLLNQN